MRNLEQLENRRLMSLGYITLGADGTLTVVGSSSSDDISITTVNGTLTATTPYNSPLSVPASSVQRININGYYGDDTITIDAATTQPASIDGGVGDDTLNGGGGATTLQGGPGSDQLIGLTGSNTTLTFGDSGNLTISGTQAVDSTSGDVDTFSGVIHALISGPGDDKINISAYGQTPFTYVDGGAGNDNISVSNVNSGVDGITVHGGAGDDTLYVDQPGHRAQIYGDDGDDTFTVDRNSNTIHDWFGGAGIDTLNMAEGTNAYDGVRVSLDDVANDGAELNNFGRPSQFTDNAHSDIEVVIGGAGDDSLVGSANNETLIGADGSDSLVGGGGNDSLSGGLDNDTLVGGAGDDTLDGGWGTNSFWEGGGHDTYVPSILPDWAKVDSGVLTITGTDSADRLGFSTDLNKQNITITLNGQTIQVPANPFITVVVNAGGGDDQVSLANLRFVATVYGGDGNDTLSGDYFGMDTLYGEGGDDTLFASQLGGTIDGGDGVNTLTGEAGNDTIISHNAADRIIGGAGNNTIQQPWKTDGNGGDSGGTSTGTGNTATTTNPAPSSYALSNGVLTIRAAVDTSETITLSYHQSSGKLFVSFNGGVTQFVARRVASVVIYGSVYADRIDATNSHVGVTVHGGAGNDLVYGSAFADRIYGGDGSDYIYANGGNDIIYGEAGNDRIFGGTGSDHIDGGAGTNTIRGELGKDYLSYRRGDNIAANAGDYLTLAPNLA